MEIRKIPLKNDQYYATPTLKKNIILHHTAGGSAVSAISTWAATAERVATPYVIERTGDIYECFDPRYWAYSLGVKGGTQLEKASIPIEIVSYGNLTVAKDKTKQHNVGDIIAWTGRAIPPEEIKKVTFRGYNYYQKYTDKQIFALKELLPYLIDRFKIKLQTDRKNFWEYRDPFTLPGGIWSHTTLRKDKVDIFPQDELVNLVYSL